MDIESIKHKNLRKLVESGQTKGVIELQRVIDMIALLDNAKNLDELQTPPNYGFHPLTGNRKGDFAMTVTKNWRLTFTKIDETTIGNLNLEDYH